MDHLNAQDDHEYRALKLFAEVEGGWSITKLLWDSILMLMPVVNLFEKSQLVSHKIPRVPQKGCRVQGWESAC